MHRSRYQQRPGNPEFLRDGKKRRAPIVLNVLASVEHVKPADPQRYRRAKNQHARIEAARDGDPCGGGRDTQSKSEKKMRPVGEALVERIEKKNGDGQRSQPLSAMIRL